MRLQGVRSSITRRLVPTRHASWQEFAVRIRGEFRAHPLWRSDEVVTRFDRWLLHLDTGMLDSETGAPKRGLSYSTHRGTEVWARLTSMDGFRFTVRDRRWLKRNPNRHEPEETEIGDARFDHAYVARSTQPAKLQRLLTEGSIIGRMSERSKLAGVGIVGPEPTEGAVAQEVTLVLWERQMVQDPEELLDLHELLLGLLEGLARLGSAAPTPDDHGG